MQFFRQSSDIPREDSPISQYPVPDISSVDPDLQERFREVERKVTYFIFCIYFLLLSEDVQPGDTILFRNV